MNWETETNIPSVQASCSTTQSLFFLSKPTFSKPVYTQYPQIPTSYGSCTHSFQSGFCSNIPPKLPWLNKVPNILLVTSHSNNGHRWPFLLLRWTHPGLCDRTLSCFSFPLMDCSFSGSFVGSSSFTQLSRWVPQSHHALNQTQSGQKKCPSSPDPSKAPPTPAYLVPQRHLKRYMSKTELMIMPTLQTWFSSSVPGLRGIQGGQPRVGGVAFAFMHTAQG